MRDIRFPIPPSTPPNRCSSPYCGKTIYWIVTRTGRNMPVDPDGISHFATCIAANAFRRRETSQ